MQVPTPKIEGTLPLRSFSLKLTPKGFSGTMTLREGTSGRTFAVDCSDGKFTFDGEPVSGVVVSRHDITGEVTITR